MGVGEEERERERERETGNRDAGSSPPPTPPHKATNTHARTQRLTRSRVVTQSNNLDQAIHQPYTKRGTRPSTAPSLQRPGG